jgi:hypothetical protein
MSRRIERRARRHAARPTTRFLGDFNRYPEIQNLNPALIKNPDLIQPTWRLVLPADAHDHGSRPHATGQLLQQPTAPDAATPKAATPDAP